MQGHFVMELLIFPQCLPKTPSFHRNAAGLPSSGEKDEWMVFPAPSF